MTQTNSKRQSALFAVGGFVVGAASMAIILGRLKQEEPASLRGSSELSMLTSYLASYNENQTNASALSLAPIGTPTAQIYKAIATNATVNPSPTTIPTNPEPKGSSSALALSTADVSEVTTLDQIPTLNPSKLMLSTDFPTYNNSLPTFLPTLPPKYLSPSNSPTSPTQFPTHIPTIESDDPTYSPTSPNQFPTFGPTIGSSDQPSESSETLSPTYSPTNPFPTDGPTIGSSNQPSESETLSPTYSPTNQFPTDGPTIERDQTLQSSFVRSSNIFNKYDGNTGTVENGNAVDSQASSEPIGSETTDVFRLKMYWQEGYMWQELPDEKWWCMACANGVCEKDGQLYLRNCFKKNDLDATFSTISYGDGGEQYKVANTNLCLQKMGTSRAIKLKPCQNTNSLQRFKNTFPGKEDAQGRPAFDIRPKDDTDRCLTQHHHPKAGELIYAESCAKAHQTKTGYWVKY